MRIFNYITRIPYLEVNEFDFKANENEIVKYDSYIGLPKHIIECAELLNNNYESRQAISFPYRKETPSCLTSIQFLIGKKENGLLHLNMVANFRSQHETLGKPSDDLMLQYFCTLFMKHTIHTIHTIEIFCSIADFHDYDI